jgi:hypothetical protein
MPPGMFDLSETLPDQHGMAAHKYQRTEGDACFVQIGVSSGKRSKACILLRKVHSPLRWLNTSGDKTSHMKRQT